MILLWTNTHSWIVDLNIGEKAFKRYMCSKLRWKLNPLFNPAQNNPSPGNKP